MGKIKRQTSKISFYRFLTYTIFNFKFLMSSLTGNLNINNIDLYNVYLYSNPVRFNQFKIVSQRFAIWTQGCINYKKSAENKVKTYRVIREQFSFFRVW